MEDIKEAEADLREKWRNETKSAGGRFKSGTYTDPNGYVWKYGLTLPTKMEAGVKYPLLIGDAGWALAISDSQAKYPCYILNCHMPETLFKPTKTGFDAPRDYKSVTAAAIKAVIDRLLGLRPADHLWSRRCPRRRRAALPLQDHREPRALDCQFAT